MPGIKLILERGISEQPQSSMQIRENKYLLDEAARSIYKGLNLLSEHMTDMDQLSSLLADKVTMRFFGAVDPSANPSPMRQVSRGGRGLPMPKHTHNKPSCCEDHSRSRSPSPIMLQSSPEPKPIVVEQV